MAIYNDVLYWTEDMGTSLFSVSLWSSQEETIVLHDIIPLSSIVIWNPELTGKQKNTLTKFVFECQTMQVLKVCKMILIYIHLTKIYSNPAVLSIL